MIIVGIDEVGRGCWAGPLVAGAVILGAPIDGVKDSKKLGPRRRSELAAQIHQQAVAVGLGWVDAATIDRVGLSTAVKWAMERALEQIKVPYDHIIVDGHINYLEHLPKTEAMIKADDRIPAASAASIVAKVARDQYMIDIAANYPGYGFEKHVGYGTALHLARLQDRGVTQIHRRSFKPVKALIK